jgi:hypothetical protein
MEVYIQYFSIVGENYTEFCGRLVGYAMMAENHFVKFFFALVIV